MTGGGAGCNKMRFASRGDAKKHVRMAKRSNVGFGSATAYVCLSPTCPPGTWHLTSQTKAEARRKAREHNARRLETQRPISETGI